MARERTGGDVAMDGNANHSLAEGTGLRSATPDPGAAEGTVLAVSGDAVMRAAIARALADGSHRPLVADTLDHISSHLDGRRQVLVFDAGSTGEEAARRLLHRHVALRMVYLTVDPFVTLRSDRVRYVVRPLVASDLYATLLRNLVASLLGR